MTQVSTPTSVLFVDDEAMILQGLKRQLRKFKDTWSMRFAGSGPEALKMLEEEPADVVVSDMRMPQMDGAELLTQVRRRYPDTVRFILSGQTDQGALMSGICSIHQFLQKPCDETVLVHSIERARRLSGEIRSRKCAQLAGNLSSLPVLSSTLNELRHAIADGVDSPRLGDIVANDPGLSCKILQLVNSAFFGIPRRVESPQMAINLLGVQQLETLCASIALFDAVSKDDPSNGMIEGIWRRCVDIGICAAKVAQYDGADATVQSDAQQAGMLSHIGRAMFVRSAPGEFKRALDLATDSEIGLNQAEREVFGTDQDALSAYLLGLWAFSDTVIEAVHVQSSPKESKHPDGCRIGNYIYKARLKVSADRVIPHPQGSNDFTDETRSAA